MSKVSGNRRCRCITMREKRSVAAAIAITAEQKRRFLLSFQGAIIKIYGIDALIVAATVFIALQIQKLRLVVLPIAVNQDRRILCRKKINLERGNEDCSINRRKNSSR